MRFDLLRQNFGGLFQSKISGGSIGPTQKIFRQLHYRRWESLLTFLRTLDTLAPPPNNVSRRVGENMLEVNVSIYY